MPNDGALPATPGNFSAAIAQNVAAAAPAPTPQPSAAQPAAQPAPATAPPASPTATPALPQPATGEQALSEAERFRQQLTQAEAANDNAQAVEGQEQDPNALLQTEQPATEQAPDPWAEEIHGMTARDVVEAIKAGEIPADLAQHVKVTAKVDGRELQISAQEAARGYQRLSDYTRNMQQVDAREQGIAQREQATEQFWQSLKQPQEMQQHLKRMGLMPVAQQMLTQGWDNPDGMLDAMWRMGMMPAFEAAAAKRVAYYESLGQLPEDLRNARLREERQYYERMTGLEAERDKIEQEKWQQQRQAQQAQRQQQSSAPHQEQQLQQQVETLREQAFKATGVEQLIQGRGFKAREAVDKVFDEEMAALVAIATRRKERVTVEELVSRAAQSTHERLSDFVARQGGQKPAAHTPAPQAQQTQQQAAPAQQRPTAQPAPLGARAAGAPTTGASPLPKSGDVSAFQQRVSTLRSGFGR